ncbi:hypothetical protein M885DRAFT_569659 [Pelagophyceae sp. CCMP2097]|nr:hypothetical protein M885DRAFT_569659 [Pelagophyceae sp. CCMP2097]
MPRRACLSAWLGLFCRDAGSHDAAAHEAAAARPRRSFFVNLVVARPPAAFVVENVEYFLRHAATHSAVADVEYKLTMNGDCPTTRRLLRDHALLVVGNEPLARAPVRQLQRRNFGYDFGGHLDALAEEAACCPSGRAPGGGADCLRLVEGVNGSFSNASTSVLCGGASAARAAGGGRAAAGGEMFRRAMRWAALRYDGYILLNCGVRGPIYPTYMPPGWHWLSAFEDKLTAMGHASGGVALVGTSLVCLNERPWPRGGGIGPRVEGFAFGVTREALLEVNGEYALSLSVLGAAGMEWAAAPWNIGSLLRLHHGVNFRNQTEWRCNGLLHPSRIGTYGGITVHPLEVLFHKGRWKHLAQDPNHREMDAYASWINAHGLRLRR